MRNRYVLLADIALLLVAAFLAFALRFDLNFPAQRPDFVPFLLMSVTLKPAVFLLFGLYARFWRYASLQDMFLVVFAVAAASIVLAVTSGVLLAFGVVSMFSRAVLLIDFLTTLVLVAGLRAAIRLAGEQRGRLRAGQRETIARRVLIVGAGEAGAMVAREMRRNPQIEMSPVGFLDDDQLKQGKRIHGSSVLGPISSLERIARIGRVEDVVIAMPRASGHSVRAIADRCRAMKLPCRTMPGVFELLDDQVSISRLRHVDISDLLRRRQVELAVGSGAYLAGRVVLVTGAGGSIGSELCRQVARAGPATLVLFGHGENSIFDVHRDISSAFPSVTVVPAIGDIRDAGRVARVMADWKPGVVFHAAAHKHVPLMEENPEEAITNNVFGTRTVVEAAVAAGVERLTMISTDKAVAPVSLMGASKRMAELVVRDAARRTGRAFVVVRFGNVLGSRGSVVPAFQRQILDGGPVTVTHPEMERFFMTIPEAVHLVVRAGGRARGGELFALNMGQPVKIVDLAEDLIRLSGFEAGEIPIVFTGLRPGEKLTEQLWESGAAVEQADGDLWRISERDDPSQASLVRAIDALHAAVAAEDRFQIDAALASCIETFVPGIPVFVPSPHPAAP